MDVSKEYFEQYQKEHPNNNVNQIEFGRILKSLGYLNTNSDNVRHYRKPRPK
jgi:hypothetical protein